MDDMHKRLRNAREAAGMKSAAEAARKVSINESTYRAYENGQNEYGPEEAEIFARVFRSDAGWLLLGTKKKNVDETTERLIDTYSSGELRNGSKKRSIPQIDAEAGAGDGNVGEVIQIASGGIMSGHLVVDEWVIPRLNLGMAPARVVALPVVGTSMLPSLGPGDVVFVDIQSSGVRNGEIYVIDEGDGPMVKRIRLNRNVEPVTIDIISENASVGMVTRPAEIVRVIGRVIGRWSRM